MADFKHLDIKRIVVFGGTGAQGSPIVRELSATNKFAITIPTRNPLSPSTLSLSHLPNVTLLHASYTSDAGLLASLTNQDACYFSLSSFTLLESAEYHWTFRAYEIAIQCGLQWFVYSGSPERFALHGYGEEYRNSHGVVSGRLSEWLAAQPRSRMEWTVVHGGVYAQMLSSLLRPSKRADGVWEFVAPLGEGEIPFVDLGDFGIRTRWVFEHPGQCVGKKLGWAPWWTGFGEVASAFARVKGEKAVFRNCEQEEWFERLRAYVDPETVMPMGAKEGDAGAVTFRKSFGAWWNLWKDSARIRDPKEDKDRKEWSDMVSPGRLQNIEEWMRNTGYTGKFEEVQKAKQENDKGAS